MKNPRTIVAAFIGAALCASVNAQEPATKVAFNIQPKPIGRALADLGEQAGLQVLVRAEDVKRDQALTPAVNGELTVRAALERVLANSELTYDFLDARTVRVRSIARKESLPLVLAQSSPRERQEVGASGTAQPSAASPSDSEELAFDEVVVTAQKRKERLQDVPISIGVLDAARLSGSTAQGVSEALNTVPGVATTEQYTGGSQVAVRGVAASGSIFNGSSPIAYYLDSMPFGFVRSSFAPDSNAYDLDRVEVLRGPQGTLYGASALNGVVRVLTRDADLDEFQITGRAALSNSEDGGTNYRGDAALNVPIVEGKLAARAVLGYQNQDGWIDRATRKDANDAELRSGRLKLNAQPTDQLSIGLTTWFSRADYGAPSISADGKRSGSLIDEPLAIDYDAYGLKVGYELPAFSITSATSYLDYQHASTVDWADFLGVPTALVSDLGSRVFSQEITLSSLDEGAWKWDAGGFYRDADDRTAQGLSFLGPAPLVDFSDGSRSFAVFGELTRRLLDGRLELTGGLRYFDDEVTVQDNLPGSTVKDTHSFNKVSPRAVITWHPQRNSTLYASYSEGFRSGVNQTPDVVTGAPTIPPAHADNLHNFELGAKGTVLDGKLQFDGAVYYIDWKDVQQSLTVNVNGFVFAAVVNGQSASGLGAEAGLTLRPTDALELGANVSWNDLTMDDDVFSGGVLLFAKGDRLNYSPRYTASTSADYRFPTMWDGLEGRVSISASYIAEQATRSILAGAQHVSLSDDVLVGRANISLGSAERWRATLFVDNFTNERGAALRQPFGIPDWDSRLRPRTVGVQLSHGF